MWRITVQTCVKVPAVGVVWTGYRRFKVMSRFFLAVCCAAAWAMAASAQDGVMGDIMSGKLVNPSVGVWAWYDIKDTASGEHLFLRQAVVGEAKVDGKNGYWIETEVVPHVGFPIVYKMLLTGPAGDPKNIHKVIVRDGTNAPQEVPVDPSAPTSGNLGSAERKSAGKENVDTAQGAVEAEHVVVEQDGKKTELWTSDKVPPMGIVKLVSPDGELVLQRYGKGGPDAESAVDKKLDLPSSKGETKVTVKVNGESREVPQEEHRSGGDAAAAADSPAPEKVPAGTSGKAKQDTSAQKKNFSKKKDAQ